MCYRNWWLQKFLSMPEKKWNGSKCCLDLHLTKCLARLHVPLHGVITGLRSSQHGQPMSRIELLGRKIIASLQWILLFRLPFCLLFLLSTFLFHFTESWLRAYKILTQSHQRHQQSWSWCKRLEQMAFSHSSIPCKCCQAHLLASSKIYSYV